MLRFSHPGVPRLLPWEAARKALAGSRGWGWNRSGAGWPSGCTWETLHQFPALPQRLGHRFGRLSMGVRLPLTPLKPSWLGLSVSAACGVQGRGAARCPAPGAREVPQRDMPGTYPKGAYATAGEGVSPSG
ncbi:hypothetical protein DR999_PMT19210 [Platysternon megacephalum]|uniref:Uncharacterized protein n=1 Tax=Platysternon megacephalum TaxID=55544 RepID=A0A4D9DVF9_9SAUR|nr:hypothetical protein DR999_PMT19210 [Platysternon megacephalum]